MIKEEITLFDCTLRDGANISGNGFDEGFGRMVLDGLLRCGITTIELGGAAGIGTNENMALTDEMCIRMLRDYLDRGYIGMFVGVGKATDKNIGIASDGGLKFLRVGSNAGEGALALDAIKRIKERGMNCEYSLMKAYVLSPQELAEEGHVLEDCGLDRITIMDSAGTMLPDQVGDYVRALSEAVKIPIAFHGHNNLGLSSANALAAIDAGATTLDCGLMGMARSAGDGSTEIYTALLQRNGKSMDVDLFGLLSFIEEELEPAVKAYNYHNPVSPEALACGLFGCHSKCLPLLRDAAMRYKVSLYRLIAEVSAVDQRAPTAELVRAMAEKLSQ